MRKFTHEQELRGCTIASMCVCVHLLCVRMNVRHVHSKTSDNITTPAYEIIPIIHLSCKQWLYNIICANTHTLPPHSPYTLTLSQSHTHTHTHILSHTLTHTHTLPHTPSSLTTHTHTLTLTLTITLTLWSQCLHPHTTYKNGHGISSST